MYIKGNQMKSNIKWYDMELTVSSEVPSKGINCSFIWDKNIKIQYNTEPILTLNKSNSSIDLKKIYPGDIIKISFEDSTSFECESTPIYSSVTITNSKLITSFVYLFYNQTYLTQVNISNIKSVKDLSHMFYGCVNLSKVVLHSINPLSMYRTFYDCTSLESVDISGSTSSCTDFNNTFYKCTNLKTIPIMIDTSSATNTSYMFYECRSLLSIPKLDISKVKYKHCMF